MSSLRTRSRIPLAFTLIELLVVVAIIALLIAILLPSLGQARAQARTVLCGTRIGQLGKALLMYSDDFGGYPPFMGCTAEGPYLPRDPAENWIFQLPTSWSPDECRDRFYCARQDEWPLELKVPRSGTLFSYARYENLYLCPDFERIRDSGKTQSVFNLTRYEWGRKFRIPGTVGQPAPWPWAGFIGEGGYTGGVIPVGDLEGPIVRVDAVYAPGLLRMLGDERWDRHVANPQNKPWWWLDTDPMFCTHDEQGQYHGTQVASKAAAGQSPIKSGSAFYYDGHVDLRRDPAPSSRDDDRAITIDTIQAYFDDTLEVIFAQRGLRAPL